MNKIKQKINLIDFLIVAILILLSLTVVFGFKASKIVDNKEIFLTIKVTSDLDPFKNAAATDLGKAYMNSVNSPIKIVDVQKNYKNQILEGIDITVSGPGEIKSDKIIFNGTRVLVGQKAEIHSRYFAQGLITEVKNEFK